MGTRLNALSEMESIINEKNHLINKAGKIVAQELMDCYKKGVDNPKVIQGNMDKLLKDFSAEEKFRILMLATGLFVSNL